MEFRAVTYLAHIKAKHLIQTGEQLAFNQVPCPTCASMLVKRNRKGTDIMFVACDKTNLPYCRFTIGLDESLEERSRRIHNKFRRNDTIDMEEVGAKRLNGFGVITL